MAVLCACLLHEAAHVSHVTEEAASAGARLRESKRQGW